MTLQLDTTLRNNMLDQITSAVGASGLLKLFSGAVPANVAAADPAGLLVTMTCNATFAPASSGGVLTLNAIASANASATGTAASFRIYTSLSVCKLQGTVTATGGGGDLTIDNTSIASGQTISETSWTITAPGA